MKSVLYETLRLGAPTFMLTRRATKGHYLDDVMIRSGTHIITPIIPPIDHSKNFEKLEEFIPDRWMGIMN